MYQESRKYIANKILYESDIQENEEDLFEKGNSTPQSWIEWFIDQKRNIFFCHIDEDFILDRFNLTGLQEQVRNFNSLIEVITDSIDYETETSSEMKRETKRFYGLIHARYILTAHGLARMKDKYLQKDFGVCPRICCKETPVVPCGQTEKSGVSAVCLYCPNCNEIYKTQKNIISKYGNRKNIYELDGAYFGKTFPHLLFQTYPELLPSNKSKYVPKIFGFELATQEEIDLMKRFK